MKTSTVKIGRQLIGCPAILEGLAAEGCGLKAQIDSLQEQLKKINGMVGEIMSPMLNEYMTGQATIVTPQGELIVKISDSVSVKKGMWQKVLDRLEELRSEVGFYVKTEYKALSPLKKSDDSVIMDCLEKTASGLTYSYKL